MLIYYTDVKPRLINIQTAKNWNICWNHYSVAIPFSCKSLLNTILWLGVGIYGQLIEMSFFHLLVHSACPICHRWLRVGFTQGHSQNWISFRNVELVCEIHYRFTIWDWIVSKAGWICGPSGDYLTIASDSQDTCWIWDSVFSARLRHPSESYILHLIFP